MATVHPNRFPTVAAPISRSIAFLVIVGALLAGCSERAARITGNERLHRGTAGLGTTSTGDTLVDRDTAVPPLATPVRGATLLVGLRGTYEARSLFRTASWVLPDSNDATVGIDSVFFRVEFDSLVAEDLPPGGTRYSLSTAGAAWDTTNVAWPDPPIGTFLGDGPDALAPFTIDLGSGVFPLVRAWARDPSFPGFVLYLDPSQGVQGVRGFRAGTGRIEIVYHHMVGGLSDTTKVVTKLPTDMSVHSPLPPLSGSETALPLGGLFRAETIFRGPVAPPPAGYSINGAKIVAHLDPTVPVFPSDEAVEIKVYRIRNAWTEGVAADSGLGLDTTPLATISAYRVRSAGDSLVVLIPPSVAREWSLNPAINQGVLLRVTDSFLHPEIRLLSRESAKPPVLRISTTTPPPERF